MKDTVVLKGTRSGIILVLNEETDYETLKKDVASKFRASSAFLGAAQKAITFRGKKLTEEQKMELVDIIQQNCELSIVCIMEDNEELERLFKCSIENKMTQLDSNTGQFFKGNLRSGQVLDVETSIIIIGDVKAGAKVV